ncbi:hypothetical protein BDW22DRAFT_1363904 [Trametopsis cervina]|nr:hypothetical protein BDW22DRAFT_1363904 [Trametopsis cervina]
MAPRRARSTSNVSSNPNIIPRAPTASPLLRKQIAVASDSIYHNNLTVLKRGDPSVVSIIDQFSHVCLYNYNGRTQKWAKEGFEGSMFIVEHVDEPIYGIYILNRMGTGDYIRRIFPEDDMEVFGKYLMYRYYPDFTHKRLALKLPYPIPKSHRPAFDAEFAEDDSEPDGPDPGKKRKMQGNSITLGIWAFQQEAHEPLDDVMIRLRDYIKAGERYPEEYRYFPGRQAPPPNRVTPPVYQQQNAGQHIAYHSGQPTHPEHATSSQPSEVDKLFAKLQPTQTPSHAPMPSVAPGQATQTSVRSVESWFAALAGQEASQPGTGVPGTTSGVPGLPSPLDAMMGPATSTRGLALLDSIFASVSQPGNITGSSQEPSWPTPRLPSQPEEIQIVSPKPQSSTLPQILSQNVISSLLGLSPVSGNSRSSSAAFSSSSSQRSGAKRYEGDNELSESEGTSEGGYSASSTVLDANTDPVVLSRGSPRTVPSLSYPDQMVEISSSLSVQGDVTPRAGFRGIGPASPLLTPQRSGQPYLSASGSVTGGDSTSPSPGASGSAAAPRGGRSLVPFSTDHELWPYPRPPLNDNEQASDADIVELDFSDTRALSDPSIFKEKQAKQHGKGDKKRKSKKDRAADRDKERAAIEDGWDDPTKGQVTLGASNSASSVASSQTDSASVSTATPNGKGKRAVNGSTSAQDTTPPASTSGTNGVAPTTADVAREALLTSLATHPTAPPRDLSRKQFVQEVLSLIYTDNAFVDRLYQQYSAPGRS